MPTWLSQLPPLHSCTRIVGCEIWIVPLVGFCSRTPTTTSTSPVQLIRVIRTWDTATVRWFFSANCLPVRLSRCQPNATPPAMALACKIRCSMFSDRGSSDHLLQTSRGAEAGKSGSGSLGSPAALLGSSDARMSRFARGFAAPLATALPRLHRRGPPLLRLIFASCCAFAAPRTGYCRPVAAPMACKSCGSFNQLCQDAYLRPLTQFVEQPQHLPEVHDVVSLLTLSGGCCSRGSRFG